MNFGTTAYFEISPVHKFAPKPKDEEDEPAPVLRLTQFTHSPKLSFEKVKLGTSKQKTLLVLNPKDQAQEVFCEKHPTEEDGFTISPSRAIIAPGETIEILLTWLPRAEGNMRELIHWKTSLGVRSQTVLLGTCVVPKGKKKVGAKGFQASSVRQPLKSHNPPGNPKASKKGVLPPPPPPPPPVKRDVPPRPKVSAKENKPRVRFRPQPSGSENRPPASSEPLNRKEKRKDSSRNGANIRGKSMISLPKKTDTFVTFSEDVHVEEYSDVYVEEETIYTVEEVRTDETRTISDDPSQVDPTDLSSCLNWKTDAYTTERTVQKHSFSDTVHFHQNQMSDRDGGVHENDFSDHHVPPSPARRQTYVKPSEAPLNPHMIFGQSQEAYEEHYESQSDTFTTHSEIKILSVKDLNIDKNSFSSPKSKSVPRNYSKNYRKSSKSSERVLSSGQEVFLDARKGILQENCLESPLRRQTCVKRSWDEMEADTEENAPVDEKREDSSTMSSTVSSTPLSDTTTRNGDVQKEMSSLTPLSPIKSKSSAKERCVHLLKKLDSMFDSPQSQDSSFVGTQSLPLRSAAVPEKISSKPYYSSFPHLQIPKMVEECNENFEDLRGDALSVEPSGNESMHTAPGSPFDFVTAPSAPIENLEYTLLEDTDEKDCNITQDFPTPKIKAHPVVDLNNLAELLRAQGLTDSVKDGNIDNSISSDSLDSSLKKEELFSPVPQLFKQDKSVKLEMTKFNNSFGKASQPDTHFHGSFSIDPNAFLRNETVTVNQSVVGPSDGDFPCRSTDLNERAKLEDSLEDYPHQRLSNGAVTLESSILHPDDIINIDEDLSPKDHNTLAPFEEPLVHNLPLLENTMPPPCEPVQPNLSIKSQFNPLLHHIHSSSSFTVPTAVPGDLEKTPDRVENKAGGQSETMASLADFSFLPGDDPKRCSTVIKSPSPTLKVLDDQAISKKKLFDDEPTSQNEKQVEKKLNNSDLATIDESDEKVEDVTFIKKSKSGAAPQECTTVSEASEGHFESVKMPGLCLPRELLPCEENVSERFVTFISGTDDPFTSNNGANSQETQGEVPSTKTQKQGLTFIEISPSKTSKKGKEDVDTKCKPAEKVFQRRYPKYPVRSLHLKERPAAANKQEKKMAKAKSTLHLPSTLESKEMISASSLRNLNSSSNLSVSTVKTTSSSNSSLSHSIKDLKRPKLRKSRQFLSQSRLMLNKGQGVVAQIHHPNPFAAKNMYYDDRWSEKQMSGFTKWLNFVLTPPEEEHQVDRKVDLAKLWMEANRCSSMQKAPTREAMSLKTYTARKRLGKLRRAACKLYQSSQMAQVISKLEMAIEKKLITIRKDRETHADMGMKQEMLKLTLCFNPLWLRIGLETVYGEVIFLNSNNDIQGLTLFIITRLLNCPEIATQYAHPTVPYSYKSGFDAALKAFQLKRFLMLVYFLDQAKTSRLIDHDPCLFNKESGFKSTRDVLLAFAREFLSGVGDITKHLAYLGYTVSHRQTALDEFDYSVSSLATDLRCGIRLTKVAEILLQNFSLCKSLRLPAVSRLQKIHNTEVALKALEKAGSISDKESYTSKDIVDGHREKTLALLWDIIFSLQIKNVLSVSRLLEEVHHLRKTLLVKDSMSLDRKKGLVFMKNLPKEISESEKKSHSTEFILQLLKLWTQLVCAHYGLEVENMTVSFCDGRAFNLILHHYHPEILKFKEICMKTTQNLCSPTKNLDVSLDDSFSGEPYYDNEEIAKRLANDKLNFNLFITKLNELGGVPILIKPSDMVNTIPDEKVTTTFLAYFCARLLDLSAEIKAARIIQLAWRKKLSDIRLARLKLETEAAVKIQKWWRAHLHQKYAAACRKAAIIIQSHWRRVIAQKELCRLRVERENLKKSQSAMVIQRCVRRFLRHRQLIRTKASLLIQKTWKMHLQRRRYMKAKSAIVQIQTAFRRWSAMTHYEAQRSSIVLIQNWWKITLKRKREEEEQKVKSSACTKIQACWRGYVAQKSFQELRHVTILLQSHIRRVNAQRHFKEEYCAVILLQRTVKAWIAMKETRNDYLQKKASAIKIQHFWRSYTIRMGFVETLRCTLVIQSSFRMVRERRAYLKLRTATLLIQQKWRATLETRRVRKEFLLERKSAITIQSCFRQWSARRKYLQDYSKIVRLQSRVRQFLLERRQRREKSATLIQTRYRAWKMMKEGREIFERSREAAIVIQKYWRGHRDRQQYKRTISAIVIQAYVKGYLARKNYNQMQKSCIILQSLVRMKREVRRYNAKKAAALTIQRYFVSWVTKQNAKKKEAALKIQSYWKMSLQRKRFLKLKTASRIIQDNWRAHIVSSRVRAEYLNQRRCCIILQSFCRMAVARGKYMKQKEAVTKIKEWYHCMKIGRDAYCHYEKMRTSSVIIQKHYRMWKQRKEFQRLKWSVRAIETRFRASLHMKRDRQNFLMQKKAAILIQSKVRGWMSRSLYLKRRQSCIQIQTWYRGARARRRYVRMRIATLLLQQHFRNFMIQKAASIEAKRRNYASVVIQRNFRMFSARKKFLEQKLAAIVIQKHCRKWSAERDYRRLLASVSLVQKRVRANRQTRLMRETFLLQKSSAIVIQKNVRMYLARKEYINQRMSIVKIQSLFRMHLERKTFSVTKRAALCIQRWFRNVKVTQACMHEYKRVKHSAITIQSCFRGYLQRQNVRKQNMAATKIQSCLRMYLERRKYLKVRHATISIQLCIRRFLTQNRHREREEAVIKIQSYWRMMVKKQQFLSQQKAAITIQNYFRDWKLAKCQRKEFLNLKSKIIFLQSHVRQWIVRKRFLTLQTASIKIQSWWRSRLAAQRYATVLKATKTIQRSYRNHRLTLEAMQMYQLQRASAIKIQAFFKEYRIRKQFLTKRRNITTIQSFFRAFIARKRYIKMKNAAILIQDSFRRFSVAKKCRATYLETRRSTITIQSYVRGFLARKSISRQHSAAIKIQSLFKMYAVRRRMQKLRVSVRLIQLRWRATLSMMKIRERYLIERGAVILIQSVWRGRIVRLRIKRENEAATKLQAIWRARIARLRIKRENEAATKLQAIWRGRIARLRIKRENEAATKLQAILRGRIARLRIKRENEAATKLQAIWRGRIARLRIKKENEAATKLQTIWRGRIARLRIKRENEAAIEAMKLRWRNASIIQKWWRNTILSLELYEEFQLKKKAAITIQRYFRKWHESEVLRKREQAVVVLQSFWRMFKTRADYKRTVSQTVLIQRWWRSQLEAKKVRCHYLYLQGCIILMQARIRGRLARKSFEETLAQRKLETKRPIESKAALVIQSSWRMFTLRRKYLNQRTSVIKLQQYWRGSLKMLIAREYFIYLRRASIILQSAWRARQARKEYTRKIKAAVTIQRSFRCWSWRKREKEELRSLFLDRFAMAANRHLAATTIQERKERAAVIIQSNWRGYSTRKALRFNRRLTRVRGRLLEATSQACESNQIGNRINVAIDSLHRYKDFKRTLVSVMVLDNSTRWSSVCCERMATQKTLNTLLFLIKSCNRSVPHMQLLVYVLNVLITLAKFDKVSTLMMETTDLIPLVTRLMKIYYDKNCALFLKCSTLLYILCYKFPMMFSSKTCLDDISELCKLMVRKLGAQTKKKNQTLQGLPPNKCPTLTLEWAMKPKEIREFSDPLLAIVTLNERLKVRETESNV